MHVGKWIKKGVWRDVNEGGRMEVYGDEEIDERWWMWIGGERKICGST